MPFFWEKLKLTTTSSVATSASFFNFVFIVSISSSFTSPSRVIRIKLPIFSTKYICLPSSQNFRFNSGNYITLKKKIKSKTVKYFLFSLFFLQGFHDFPDSPFNLWVTAFLAVFNRISDINIRFHAVGFDIFLIQRIAAPTGYPEE